MNVKIYQPCKSVMQSGKAKTHNWVLEYELESARVPDPLMGWASSTDTYNQVRLKFDTCDEAMTFANSKGWVVTVLPSQDRIIIPRNYVDNFKYIPAEIAE
jgi:ETC complex I subunit conserved region